MRSSISETMTMDFPVGPRKEAALREKMVRFNVREEDIRERFIRSSGAGGQNVNKTSTCVSLTHGPTGIQVKCQRERSQGLNRYVARVLLVRKIEERILGKESEERQRQEKIRRQKRKRSKRAKLKMLEDKHKHALKKASRSGVSRGQWEV